MGIFHIDASFVLALIAVVFGAFLVLFAKIHHKEVVAKQCSIIGIVVVVLSIIVLLVSSYGMSKRAYYMNKRMSMQRSGMIQKMKKPIKPMLHKRMKKNIKSMR